MLRISRPILACTVIGLCVASVATPASAVPRDPCSVLTRAQVQHLLVGKQVLRVKRRSNAENQAVECRWVTAYFQTPSLRRVNNPLSLVLTLQPVTTARAAVDDLRARVRNPTNETTGTIPNLGDEAYSNVGDAIVVSGAVIFQVGVSNYDTSAKPYPKVDTIAHRAAAFVLERLAPQGRLRPSIR